MRNRPAQVGGRSVGLLVLAIVVAGVAGSVVSHFLAGAFPAGPVRDFFFKSLDVGVPAFTVGLGFAKLTLGFSFSVTTFAVMLVLLVVYLWYKF